jgi:phage tail sheath protein FI
MCTSSSDYENTFGGLDPFFPMSYAVYLFFLNGGTQALVVRTGVTGDATYQGSPLPSRPVPIGDPASKTGIYALLKADIFNILCLPVDPEATYDRSAILSEVMEFCVKQRAMHIVDPPSAWSKLGRLDANTVVHTNPALAAPSENAAIYYPNLIVFESTGAAHCIGPCGAIAGVWARNDAHRGVWTAPAGPEAVIQGVADFTAAVHDDECGVLNPIAVNALRIFPEIGPVIWGARTTKGADRLSDQWKYVPVRRTALFIEESLDRGTKWAIFEPNGEALWAALRFTVESFMLDLFRQGAFQGHTASEAFLVRCDASNNPQSSIDRGVVNILVGFAPLKPAEFVLFNIQQPVSAGYS